MSLEGIKEQFRQGDFFFLNSVAKVAMLLTAWLQAVIMQTNSGHQMLSRVVSCLTQKGVPGLYSQRNYLVPFFSKSWHNHTKESISPTYSLLLDSNGHWHIGVLS